MDYKTCRRCGYATSDHRRTLCDDCAASHRWCNKCQTTKPLDEFFRASARGLGGYTRYCKVCHNARQHDPAKKQHYKDYHYHYHLKRKFGISMEEAAELASVEKCQCCGAPPNGDRLHVDHDHATGKIRGVICRRCNFAVAVLEESKRLDAIAKYLSR